MYYYGRTCVKFEGHAISAKDLTKWRVNSNPKPKFQENIIFSNIDLIYIYVLV
jgi:hypothetical protein